VIMAEAIYQYAREDLLENRNTYFYTEYNGAAFIVGWRATRSTVKNALSGAISPASAADFDPDSRLTKDLIECAIAGDESLGEKFVAKFEITKRIHLGYGDDFRALNKDEHHNIDLYLRAADLFAQLYGASKSSRHLNVYLKCMDTLVGLSAKMETEAGGRLAWHIAREEQYISSLMAKLELSL
jgi:hypothetical protein